MPQRPFVQAMRGCAVVLALLALAGPGCSNKEGVPASAPASAEAPADAGVSGTANRNGSQLAYEHDVRIRLAADRIAANVAATRDACLSQRFGECTLLGEELGAGESPTGDIRLRAAPAAIAGLVGVASAQGEVAQRSTRAEDLAEAVRDNGLRRARLALQHRKLGEILERRDLKPEDLFALTERMAELEAQLQAADMEALQQQRRINTNLLSIHFESASMTVASSRIGEALRGVTSTWDASAAWMITVSAALLPFAAVALVVLLLVRRFRRPSPRVARHDD